VRSYELKVREVDSGRRRGRGLELVRGEHANARQNNAKRGVATPLKFQHRALTPPSSFLSSTSSP